MPDQHFLFQPCIPGGEQRPVSHLDNVVQITSSSYFIYIYIYKSLRLSVCLSVCLSGHLLPQFLTDLDET